MKTRRESTVMRWTAGAAVLAAVAVGTTACGAAGATPFAQPTAGQSVPGGQVAVNCGAGQQALIRPVVMNGQSVSQVDCVAAPIANAAPQAAVPAGVPYAPAAGYGYAPAPYAPVGYAPAPVQQTAPVYTAPAYGAPAYGAPVYAEQARPATYRTVRAADDDYVTYRPARRVRTGRSVKKSAIIIGSSAGIAAGVGAAAGGKKGALIGAAIGGGGAAIWDQITRDKR